MNAMPEVVATRRMFMKVEDAMSPTEISISKPMAGEDGLYVCRVTFTNLNKYSASLKGVDGINALECALSYIDSVCANNDDPEFHWEASGGRYKGRPD
jgi:hypothetical protein